MDSLCLLLPITQQPYKYIYIYNIYINISYDIYLCSQYINHVYLVLTVNWCKICIFTYLINPEIYNNKNPREIVNTKIRENCSGFANWNTLHCCTSKSGLRIRLQIGHIRKSEKKTFGTRFWPRKKPWEWYGYRSIRNKKKGKVKNVQVWITIRVFELREKIHSRGGEGRGIHNRGKNRIPPIHPDPQPSVNLQTLEKNVRMCLPHRRVHSLLCAYTLKVKNTIKNFLVIMDPWDCSDP